MRDFHLDVDLVPEKAVAEELVKALQKEHEIENETFLLVQAEGARDVVFSELSRLGGIVDQARAYRTVPETSGSGIARFREEGADIVTFTSASTVENFAALKLALPAGAKTASIGPVTSAALHKLGMKVDIEAKKHDLDGLVKAMTTFSF